MSGTKIKGLDGTMRRPFVTIAIMLAVILMAAACSGGAQNSQGSGTELALQARTDNVLSLAKAGSGTVASPELRATLSDMIRNPDDIIYRRFLGDQVMSANDKAFSSYKANEFRPLWVTADGNFSPAGVLLLDRLESVELDALDPANYRVAKIIAAKEHGNVTGMAAAELMLSDALIRYSADLKGRNDRDNSLLARAIASDDLAAFFDDLAPSDPGYVRLRDALVKYDTIAMVGGWEAIPGGPTLRTGDSNSRIPALRHRLALSGDLPQTANTELNIFDKELERAVKRFQARHGLDADGAIGRRTLRTLNVPVETRITQLTANLRLQRKPESRIAERAIVVNLAAFELILFDGGEEVLRSRAVVGQPGWETPRVVSELKWLEINPTWSVPRRIAAEEIVPRLRKHGTDYLEKRGFRVFDAKWREMDTENLDFAAIDGDNLPFILRQDPGPANPLGNVKFMFPNGEDIFLHDTRQRRLFNRARRALSHGCVRVEAADELALFLLREEGWAPADYEKVLKSGQSHRVRLANPMPIHIVTRTAWAEADDLVQFRDDPYTNGPKLQIALN